MVSISILVTAPPDSPGYPYLDELQAQTRGLACELILADARRDGPHRFGPDVRHLALAGRSVQGLIGEGIRQATGDWILLTEDHCRPLPGLLDAYRKAIGDHPGIDLFAGGVENLTSTSPWSFCSFLAGLNEVWPPAQSAGTHASNANLLVRRSAVPLAEIATDGGFLVLTIERLIAEGRCKTVHEARVDHIVHTTALATLRVEHRIVTAAVVARRAVLPRRPAVVQFLRDLGGIAYYVLVSPWLITARLRGTAQFSLGTVARLSLLGLAIGIVPLQVDLRRWFRRAAPIRQPL